MAVLVLAGWAPHAFFYFIVFWESLRGRAVGAHRDADPDVDDDGCENMHLLRRLWPGLDALLGFGEWVYPAWDGALCFFFLLSLLLALGCVSVRRYVAFFSPLVVSGMSRV